MIKGYRFKPNNGFCIICVVFAGILTDNNITNEEVVAVMLHELFHNFADIIQNKIECSVLTDNAFLNTTKPDTRSHGIGIKSITTTLDEINRIINFIEKDGWFIADPLIPFES